MEIEEYQEKFKKDLNKNKITQTIFAVVLLCIYGASKFFFEFNPDLISPYVNPLNIAAFVLLVLIWRYKFAGGLKCPRCQNSLGYIGNNKHRYQKRCCGNCGLLYNPSVKLHNAKKSFVGEQTIRSGFLNGLIFFGFALAAVGFYVDEQMVIIGGFVTAGFIFLLKLILPTTNCKSCGNPKPIELKYCEHCGEPGNGVQ